MVAINSEHTELIPILKIRDGSLAPEDIFYLTVQDLSFKTGQEVEDIVTSIGDTNVLIGTRMPTKVMPIKAIEVPIEISKRLLKIQGQAYAVRDKRFETFGGVVEQVTSKGTIKYVNHVDEVTISLKVDSSFPAIVPEGNLLRQPFNIITI